MENDPYLKELEVGLKAEAEHLRNELQAVRSNRPSPELVENLIVAAYDQMLPVKQLGSLSIVPPREIHINVWDKSLVGPVTKAIENAHVGLSVSTEGNVIRATLSPLGAERREELLKLVKKTVEESRIKIRSRRDEAMKKIKAAEAAKTINEDDSYKLKEKAQKLVDEVNKNAEMLLVKKVEELGE